MILKCPQLKIQLQELKSLFGEYVLALEQAKASHNLQQVEQALVLKTELETQIKKLKESLIITPEQAREIMGADFLGHDAVEKAIGVHLEQRDIPAIPFSKEDLERAKELGQMLILHVDKAPDGEDLSMVKLNSLLKERFVQENKGKVLFMTDIWDGEDFYHTEAPSVAWTLVSKEIIPNSVGKNYLEQTEALVAYIQNSVFKDMTMPQEYVDAIAEFEVQKIEIADLINTINWPEAARRLSDLKLNQLTRQTPVETLYDIDVRLLTNGDRLLEETYTWTKRRSFYDRFISVGWVDVGGASVDAHEPGSRFNYLGVSFSRRA